MLRKKAETIADLLRAFMREQGLETPLNELRAADAWSKVVPASVVRYTKQVNVHGGVMYVSLTNPSLRANIMMARTQLVHRINAIVGAQAINSIVFR